ncbi:MAG: helix-turn-helix domain-containing protein, partial [Desulfobacteraceae bacterium]
REDLYYRLNVISIQMPALREIKADIPHLVHHFMKKFSRETHRKVSRVAPEVMDLLMGYDWPGNVRQLENIIERAFALGEGDIICSHDLPSEIRNFDKQTSDRITSLNLNDNEKILIMRALHQTDGNKADAAKLLGINITTVYRKMEKYKISDELIQNYC